MNATLQQLETYVEQYVLLHNVSWETYVRLCDEIGEVRIRFTYADGDLEIMTVSFGHEHAGEWVGRLVPFIAMELDVPLCSGGSTTLRSPSHKKALEPDKCFWTANAKAMRGKKEWTADDPPPDLAIEVDVTSSSLNRLAIYAALGVPEVWRFHGKAFDVLVLRGGKYRRAAKSRSFPSLPLAEFARFIDEADVEDETQLLRSFRKWLQKVLSR